MRKLTILLICLFALSAYSQEQIIFQKSSTENYLLRYKSNPDYNQAIVNQMLSDISRSLNQGVYNLEFAFSHQQNIRINKSKAEILVEVDILDFKYASELYYKQFNLANYLIPSRIAFKGDLYRSDRVVSSFEVNETQIDGNKRFSFKYIDSSQSNKYSFQLKQKVFTYEPDAVKQLKNYLILIDDYYLWDGKFRAAISNLDMINPEDPDQLENNDDEVTRMQGLVHDFDRSDMANVLNLDERDPIQLKKRVEYLNHQLIKAREAIEYTYSIIHEIYYRRGLESMLNGNPKLARSLFFRSLDANRSFAPALFQLASMDFSEGQTVDAADRIRELFKTMNPDPETKLLAIELANDIYEDYIGEAVRSNDKGDYYHTLSVLEYLEIYCSDLYVVECKDDIVKNKIVAHLGNYRRFIAKSSESLNQGKIEEADGFIDQAINYQKDNQNFIMDANEAMLVKVKIKNELYISLINSGKTNLKSGNFETAFDQFKNAKELENEYEIKKQTQLDALLKQAVKPIILAYINLGNEQVEFNNIEKAKNYLRMAREHKNQYFQSADKEIEEKIGKLQHQIFSQECMNAETAYNTYLISALDMSEVFQYSEADKLLQLALDECQKLPDCGLDYSDAVNEMTRINLPATYQRMIEEANQFSDKSKYEASIQKYLEAGEYFEMNQVNSFGLFHKSTLDFIIISNNFFVKYGLNHFIKENEVENAMQLLVELKGRNYSYKFLKPEQTVLGQKMAEADSKNGISGNPKEVVLKYTQEDKWYKYFAKSYIRQLKKLRK